MALDPDRLMGLPPIVAEQTLTKRDTMLYALGLGVGAHDPTDPSEMRFVYEAELEALPTMPCIMGYPGFWQMDPKYGLDWPRVLSGEVSVEIHAPLPVEGELIGSTMIEEIFDRGAEKGAIILSSRKVAMRDTGAPIATVRTVTVARGDGGFGGAPFTPAKTAPLPARSPDRTLAVSTRIDQALLYRLSGDYNPLHADPDVAASAGYRAPILHGVATLGVAGRALLKALCDNDPTRVKRIGGRFSSPVYPGEALQIDLWETEAGCAAWQVRAPERNVVVLQNGQIEFEV